MTELDQALEHHKAGRLQEAEALYRELLAREPEHPDALHWLGVVAFQGGQHERAVELIGRALAFKQDYAEAHNNLGLALRAAGRLAEAVAAYRRALILAPDDAEVYNNLGIALSGHGDLNEAVAAFERAVTLSPDFADAYNNLGNALRQLGHVAEAEQAYRAALGCKNDNLEALVNLGALLEAERRLAEAEGAYRRATALAPELAGAWIGLGDVLDAQDRLPEAEQAYRTAVQLDPGDANAHIRLGLALQGQRRLADAEAAYRTATGLAPGLAGAWVNLGHALERQSRVGEAEAAYRGALGLAPALAGTHMNLGNVLKSQGRMPEAEQAYRAALALQPGYAQAYANLVTTKKYTSGKYTSGDDADRTSMLELLRSCDLPDADAVHLHFALGKIDDDRGEYDAAFAHYREGNRIKRQSTGFSASDFSAHVGRLIHTFDAALFARGDMLGARSELPVFIIGMARSGTTLVEQILSSHPAVHGAGELDRLAELAAGLSTGGCRGYPQATRELDDASAQRLAREYEARLRRDAPAGVQRASDKMPSNFLRLGLIALLFPQARVIHCRRDPLDVCLSIFFQEFSTGNDFAYDLTDIGWYYRQYERLMAHWRGVLPLKIFEIQYEDLVADTEAKTRALIEFLDLPWDQRCLAYTENRRPIQTGSIWQARQPIYASSVRRWRNYEKHLGPLKEALGVG